MAVRQVHVHLAPCKNPNVHTLMRGVVEDVHTFRPSFVSLLGQAAVLVNQETPKQHPQADNHPDADECDHLGCHVMAFMVGQGRGGGGRWGPRGCRV